MIPPRKLLPLLALVVLVTACSGKPQWVRPGTSNDTVSDDLDDCKALANAETRRDAAIDQDILATRGADWERNNTLQAKKNTFATQDQGRARDIIASCMGAKGYTPARRSGG
ncbi:MAG TPA: hypothetical protein VKB68_12975 [Stellaceae bacterium]|nr:hypothetical protein [Stellaceae bacterium]